MYLKMFMHNTMRQYLVLRHYQQFYSKRYEHEKKFSTSHIRRYPIMRYGLLAAIASFLYYDGVVNDFTHCGSALRFLRSLKTATLIAIDYIELSENDPYYDVKLKAVHQKSANRLLETCLRNGGLYIKVGQGFAAINHILPIEYTSTLAKLQNECLHTKKEDVKQLFLKDFGCSPEQMFVEFDYKPIAAASLAQVFKAKLPSGEPVAVKVQYNDLQKRFVSDLGTIIFLQNIIEFFFKNYNFGWILNDLSKNLMQELNFVNEAHNTQRCARDLRKFSYVYVPKVYWDYTKTRVLTLEWMDGFKISDMDKIKKYKLNRKDIDVKLFTIFAEQIFRTGFVHADPHPGNILLRPKNNSGQVDIVLLDHGLYEQLPQSIRLPLCEFWEATVLRNEKLMAKSAKKLGIIDYVKFAEVLFQQPIRIHRGQIKNRLTEQDIMCMQKVATQHFESIMSTLKEMPRNMLFIVRNLNTIRAIGRLHGDVVDRPRIMARYAQNCLYERQYSPLLYMKWLYRRMYFEYCLWCNSLKLHVINWYFNILYLLGRAPKTARTLLHDLTVQADS